MTIVFSPSAFMSTTARRERPIRREISWVRPPILPFTDSRSMRSLVERGSIEYSAVTQPLPLPVMQRGTPLVKDAVHSTLVRPKEISAEPSAWSLHPRSIVTSRRALLVRPSARRSVMACSASFGSIGRGWQMDCTGVHQVHRGDFGAQESPGESRELALALPRRLESVGRRFGRRALQAVLDQLAIDVIRGLLRARHQGDLTA